MARKTALPTAPTRLRQQEVEETRANLAALSESVEALQASLGHLRTRLEETERELATEEKLLADAQAAADKALAEAEKAEASEDKRVLTPLRNAATAATMELDGLLAKLDRIKDTLS